MNNLMNNEIRITSVELINIINKFRLEEGNETEKLHKTLMRDIRNEMETLELAGVDNQHNFVPVKYKDNKGEERPCYSLNRDGMLQMLNKESALVRYKTQQYINALENELSNQIEKQPKLPSTYKEALQQLLFQIEENEKLEEARNKLIHQGKLYNTTELAKELGVIY